MLDQAAWKALTFVGILGGAVYTGSLYTSAVLSDVSRVPRDYDTISNGTNLPRLPGISAVTDVFESFGTSDVTHQQWRKRSSTPSHYNRFCGILQLLPLLTSISITPTNYWYRRITDFFFSSFFLFPGLTSPSPLHDSYRVTLVAPLRYRRYR